MKYYVSQGPVEKIQVCDNHNRYAGEYAFHDYQTASGAECFDTKLLLIPGMSRKNKIY